MKRLRGSLTLVISAIFVLMATFLFFESKTAGDRRDALSVGLFFLGAAIVSLASSVAVQARQQAQARRAADTKRAAFRVNNRYFGAMSFGALCWVAAGVTNLNGSVWPAWLSWAVIAFAGVCALGLFALAADWREKLVIDAQGIHDYGAHNPEIAWARVQITSFVMPNGAKTSPTLRILPDDSRSDRRTLSGRYQLDGDQADILAAVLRFAPAACRIEASPPPDDD